jgi:hypothetical protein
MARKLNPNCCAKFPTRVLIVTRRLYGLQTPSCQALLVPLRHIRLAGCAMFHSAAGDTPAMLRSVCSCFVRLRCDAAVSGEERGEDRREARPPRPQDQDHDAAAAPGAEAGSSITVLLDCPAFLPSIVRWRDLAPHRVCCGLSCVLCASLLSHPPCPE